MQYKKRKCERQPRGPLRTRRDSLGAPNLFLNPQVRFPNSHIIRSQQESNKSHIFTLLVTALNPSLHRGVKVVLTIINFGFSIFITSGLAFSGSSAHATPRVIRPKTSQGPRANLAMGFLDPIPPRAKPNSPQPKTSHASQSLLFGLKGPPPTVRLAQ